MSHWMLRTGAVLAGSGVAGVVLAAGAAWVVLGYGPEALFDLGEAVYSDEGAYLGLRC